MVLSNELIQLLEHGEEERFLEYKGNIPWSDRSKRLEIIQTIIAMSNLRDGGVIIIGVDNKGTAVGLSGQNADTFSHDKIHEALQGKTNQALAFTVRKYKKHEGKIFVFIQISESKEYPVVYTGGIELKNQSQEAYLKNIGLRSGALYIRGRSNICTKEIETLEEWQELIERANARYKRESQRRNTSTDDSSTNPYDGELII